MKREITEVIIIALLLCAVVDFYLSLIRCRRIFADPLMSGSELMTYNNTPFMLDFENLFEDSSDTAVQSTDNNQFTLADTSIDDQITTPVSIKKEPSFPATKRNNPK